MQAQPSLHQSTQLYSGFMNEIQLRMVALRANLERLRSDLQNPWAFAYGEFCFLQIRLICEGLALAALSVHHDLPGAHTSRILKEWRAGDLFDRLSLINPHCFPTPVRATQGAGQLHFADVPGPHLDRAGLSEIYDYCGHILHRGGLKNYLAGKRKSASVERIHRFLEDINNLLGEHVVLLPAHHRVIIVNFLGVGRGVQIIHAESVNQDGFTRALN